MAQVDFNKLQESFGFLMAQDFSIAAPKRTGQLARTFMATMQVEPNKIKFTLPYYAGFVIRGTSKQLPNHFLQETIHQKAFKNLVKAIKLSTS